MENSTKVFGQFHDVIRTKHVFIEGQQVFMKREVEETFLEDAPEWFPTDFKWDPIRLEQNHQSIKIQSK